LTGAAENTARCEIIHFRGGKIRPFYRNNARLFSTKEKPHFFAARKTAITALIVET